MKHISKIFMIALPAMLLVWGCKKVDKLPYYEAGEPVTLSVNKTEVTPTPADSLNPILTFTWSDPHYATDTSNYKFILEIDTLGSNFSTKVTKEILSKNEITLTGKELNNILLNYGSAIGVPQNLEARIVSSYANNNEQYKSNVVGFKVSPYADASELSVSPNTMLNLSIANASQHIADFSWTPSFNGYSGQVHYYLQYDSSTKNFANAKEMEVGIAQYQLGMTQGEINQTALAAGVVGGSIGKVSYRVKAVTEQGAIAYSNAVDVTMETYVPSYNFYLVGSINGWDINNPFELISDKNPSRWGKIFYTYIYLNAGDEFKFAKTKGDWGSAYGNVSASGSGYTTGFNQGGNFSVTTPGVYRLTLDVENNMAYIQLKQVGMVGAMQGWNASSPITGGYLTRDKFLIITNSTTNDEFKFHDGSDWDNSAPYKARYWGEGSAPGLLDLDGSGPNLKAPGSQRTRAVWDGTDPQQLKYELSPANEMRVVGNGIQGTNDWDPSTSPQMTYQGNGIWTITLTLVAGKEIKFLSGNAWGEFDYEDAGDNGSAGGTIARKINWTGGSNFSTPSTTGSYTITLNEYNQTVTIQ